MMFSIIRLAKKQVIVIMSKVKRSEVYAVVSGVSIVDGDYQETEHTVVGRHNSIEKYVQRARKLYPDFLPREVRVYCSTFAMPLADFMRTAAQDGKPVDITEEVRERGMAEDAGEDVPLDTKK